MTTTLKKMNFYVDEDVRRIMETLVPAGMRAKVINEALRKEMLRITRERAHGKLLHVRSTTKHLSDKAIVNALRKDRSRA